MDKKRLSVEQREQGAYVVRRPNSARASAIASTQRETIERARQLYPDKPPLVERVSNTKIGGRDQWRKP